MNTIDDSSVLCWGYQNEEPCDRSPPEDPLILAPNPRYFKNCHNIQIQEFLRFRMPSVTMTANGLRISLPVRVDLNHENLVYGILGCGPPGGDEDERIWAIRYSGPYLAIPLISTAAFIHGMSWVEPPKDEYLRMSWCTPTVVSLEFLEEAETRELLIRQSSQDHLICELPFTLTLPPPTVRKYEIFGMYPPQPIGTPFISFRRFPSAPVARYKSAQGAMTTDENKGSGRHEDEAFNDLLDKILSNERREAWMADGGFGIKVLRDGFRMNKGFWHEEESQRMVHLQVDEECFLILFPYEAFAL